MKDITRRDRRGVEDTMVNQDSFGMVSAGSKENYVPSHGISAGSKINYVPSPVVSEIALAYSARVYHRKAHRPRPAQSEDETESGDRCPESQDE